MISKSLARALIDAGVPHYALGGDVPFSDALKLKMAGGNVTLDPALVSNFNNLYGDQYRLAQTLLGQTQGLGPNPAMAALNQTTGQNIAAQNALMAGQRGASVNPALIAKMAAQQGAGIQQQAIGQGATLQAQQQLAAQQALQQQQQAMNQALAQQESLDLQSKGINVNADMAAQQSQNALLGGILQAGGAMAGGLGGGGKTKQMLASGGQIPGKAEVKGDSEKNDRVPALLSPGEVVLPRSVTQSKDPVKKAAEFMKHLMEEKKSNNYGDVIKAKKSLQDRVTDLEKKMSCGGYVK